MFRGNGYILIRRSYADGDFKQSKNARMGYPMGRGPRNEEFGPGWGHVWVAGVVWVKKNQKTPRQGCPVGRRI